MNTESSGVGLKEQRKKRAVAWDLRGKRTFSDQDDANLYFNFISVRLAKFVSRKQWVVPGADDMFIRVYNYNTMDKVKVFEAHTDYIRCVAVHPTLPYVLSSSDDMLIKLWDWDKGWMCTQIFEGHSYYYFQSKGY